MSEVLDFHQKSRKAVGSARDAWFARWIFEKPDDEPIYAQQFRNEMAVVLRAAGISMPDINQSLSKFFRAGMLEHVSKEDVIHPAHAAVYYVPVAHKGWQPYAEFFAEHIDAHGAEFAEIDAAIPHEELGL